MAGSYRKRGDKYLLEYMYKGKRYNKTIDCAKSDVKTELMEFVLAIQKNYTLYNANKLNFLNFSQEWIDNYVRKNLKPRTIDFYLYLLNSRLIPFFAQYKLTEIRKSDIKKFLNDISNDITQSTIKKYRNCLVSMFNYAIEMEYLNINPASSTKLPNGKKIEKKINCYNIEQLKKLLACLENEKEEAKMFVYIIAFTGMRREECLPLCSYDINLEENKININKAMVFSNEKGLIIDSTKNKHSNRIISIPTILTEELKSYNKRYSNDRLFNFTPNSITQWFNKFIKRNNLDYITLHGLRHTYATYLISQNKDINIISTLLGHADVNITGRIYIEKDHTNEIDAVSSFNNFLS